MLTRRLAPFAFAALLATTGCAAQSAQPPARLLSQGEHSCWIAGSGAGWAGIRQCEPDEAATQHLIYVNGFAREHIGAIN